MDEGNRMAILASTTNEDVQARRATTAYVAPGAPARRSVASAIAESSEGRKSLGAQRVTKRLRFNGGGDEAPPASSASQAPVRGTSVSPAFVFLCPVKLNPPARPGSFFAPFPPFPLSLCRFNI